MKVDSLSAKQCPRAQQEITDQQFTHRWLNMRKWHCHNSCALCGCIMPLWVGLLTCGRLFHAS